MLFRSIIHAGHGLNIHNVADIAKIDAIEELNIGHALIAQSIFIGLPESIKQMKNVIFQARWFFLSCTRQ